MKGIYHFIAPEWRKLDRRERKLAYEIASRAVGTWTWFVFVAVPFMFSYFWFSVRYSLLILAACLLPPLLVCVIHRATLRGACWAILAARGEPICTTCGYDLTGNISGRCPECGKEVAITP